MSANEYHFITHWRVQGDVKEVADVLSDAPDLARWWPAVYLEVEETKPGDDEGIGKEVSLYTKGWLPYTLRWQFRVTESNYPHGFTLEAWGDFEGRGEWTLEQDGSWVNVTYDWRLQAEKPLLRRLSFLLRPIFEKNHLWAMARGEESLRLELARRAAPEHQRRMMPAPQGPTDWRAIMLPGAALAAAAAVLVSAKGIGAMLRRRGNGVSD